jgi:spermidine synthase
MINEKRIILISFILSLCSFCYEYILVDLIAVNTDFNSFIINTTIALFILGLGCGSFFVEKISSNFQYHLILIEKKLIISALFLLLFPFILFLNEWLVNIPLKEFKQYLTTAPELLSENYNFLKLLLNNSFFYNIISCLFIFTLSFIIGLFSGYELPLLVKFNNEKNSTKLIAFNYFGSLAASFLFIFILKKYVEIQEIIIIVSIINVIIILLLSKNNYRFLILYVLLCLILYPLSKHGQKVFIKSKFYNQNHSFNLKEYISRINNYPDIIEKATQYQMIQKFPYFNNNKKNEFGIFLNYKYQFTSFDEPIYHDSLTHIPIDLFNITPNNVLVLGAGDGLVLREILKYNTTYIKQIELDEEFFNFCKFDRDISKLNKNSLKSDRVVRVFNDAYSEVKKEDKKYDLIIVDFPYPNNFDLLKLYSIEFYKSLKKILNKDGIIVLDAPIISKKYLNSYDIFKNGFNNNSIIMSTIHFAGFKTIYPFTLENEGIVILSMRETVLIDLNKIKKDKLNRLTIKKLNYLSKKDFMYKIDKSLINSTFKPKMLKVEE